MAMHRPLALICVTALLAFGCKSTPKSSNPTSDPTDAGTSAQSGRSGAGGAGGAGGSSSDSLSGGTGGSRAGSGAGGAGSVSKGGSGGNVAYINDAGTQTQDAAVPLGGNQAQAGTAGNAGGAGGAGGASGNTGTGGAAASGDPTIDQCIADATTAGLTVDACIRCMCQPDKCQAELNTTTHDTKASTLAVCSQKQACTDVCCLCGTSTCDGSNYASGPCADEVQLAAGVTPGAGLLGAATVASACSKSATDNNSCHHVTVLADCEKTKCADVCPIATSCP